MKNTYQSFQESLNIYIVKEYESIKRRAISDAQSVAKARGTKEDIDNYMKGVASSYAVLLETVKGRIEMANEIEQQNQKSVAVEAKKNEADLKTLKTELLNNEADLGRCYISYDWSQYWLRIIGEVIIFGAEISFNSQAFTVIGGPIIFAILPALMFAVASGLMAFFIPRFLRGIKSALLRICAAIAAGAFVILIFFGIGLLRSTVALGDGTLNSITEKPVLIGTVIFTLINLFMFCAGMILLWGLPSKEERLKKQEFDKLSKRIKRTKEQIERLTKSSYSLAGASNKAKPVTAASKDIAHFEVLIHQYCEITTHAFVSEVNLKKQS